MKRYSDTAGALGLVLIMALVIAGSVAGCERKAPAPEGAALAGAAGTTGVTHLTALTLEDDLIVGDDGTITDALTAADLTATDDLIVGDDGTITGTLTVVANVAAADLTATDDLVVGDDGTITGTLTVVTNVVAGDIATNDDLTVGDDITIAGDLRLGAGTPGKPLAGDDVYITGDLEVDGGAQFDGAISAKEITASGDLTLSPHAGGGNAGAKIELVGLPRIALRGFGQGTNGAAAGKTLALDDDTPSGEFSATDADVVCSDDNTIYREGANGLKMLFTTAADDGDGCHDGVAYDFTDDESVGFFLYCNTTLTAGDLQLELTDDGGVRAIDVPAVATADFWTWIDLTTAVTALANADKDVISDVSFELSAAGAAKAAGAEFACWVDAAYKWDATEEDAIGLAVLRDGQLGIVNTETGASLTEHTDFFIHEESGNDYAVWITDQSAADLVGLFAY